TSSSQPPTIGLIVQGYRGIGRRHRPTSVLLFGSKTAHCVPSSMECSMKIVKRRKCTYFQPLILPGDGLSLGGKEDLGVIDSGGGRDGQYEFLEIAEVSPEALLRDAGRRVDGVQDSFCRGRESAVNRISPPGYFRQAEQVRFIDEDKRMFSSASSPPRQASNLILTGNQSPCWYHWNREPFQ
ncbi:MAG TPA: hypothetical protein VJA66_17360, partial [Thermoanaerobaculia bacterium]